MSKTFLIACFSLLVLAGCGTTQAPAAPVADMPTPDPVVEDNDMDNDQADEEMNDDQVNTLEGSVTLNLDTENSVLGWEGSRPLYSYTGTVDYSNGTLELQDGEPVGGSFTINMTTIAISNGSARVVEHLSSDDFFDVANYPEAILMINEARATATPNEYLVSADLNIKGNTNPITFIAQFNDARTQATGSFNIDRSLWDIRFGSDTFFDNLGDRAISNTIEFNVNVVFN